MKSLHHPAQTKLLVIWKANRSLIESALKNSGLNTYCIEPSSEATEYIKFESFTDIQPLIKELSNQGLNPTELILY